MEEGSRTDIIRKRYNRTDLVYDRIDWMIPERFRRKAIEQASGNVLEIVVGTGFESVATCSVRRLNPLIAARHYLDAVGMALEFLVVVALLAHSFYYLGHNNHLLKDVITGRKVAYVFCSSPQ